MTTKIYSIDEIKEMLKDILSNTDVDWLLLQKCCHKK